MNEGDAAPRGVLWVERPVGGTLQRDGAGVGLEIAAEDVHQRGFARAVLTDQPDHAARRHGEAHALEDLHAEEGFLDAPEREEFVVGGL